MKRLTAVNPGFPKEWGIYMCAVRARNECCTVGACATCDYLGDMINKLGALESKLEKQNEYNYNDKTKNKESQ